MISIYLNPDTEAKLAAFAATLGTSEAALASRAVEELVEEMEDIKLAEQRLSEGNERLSFEEMRQRLGLEQ